MAKKILALLQYQGWLILFPPCLFFAFRRDLASRLLMPAGLLAACVAWLALPQYRFLDKSIFVIGIVGGVAILWHMARPGLADRGAISAARAGDTIDSQFLWCWYFGVSVYCLLVFTNGSARYILPLVPPVLIVFWRRLETWGDFDLNKWPFLLNATGAVCITAALSGAWGLALAHADFEFASVYPRAAREFVRRTGKMASFFGGEWGFRYYLAQAGVRQLSPENGSLPGGSWLVRPKLALPYEVDEKTLALTIPVQRLTYEVNTPLRLLSWNSPAGFYSTFWGKIAFSLSRDPLEEFDIRQVSYLAERLPAAVVESEHGTKPALGQMTIRSNTLGGILVYPGTRLSYPLDRLNASMLKLKCGVSPDAYVAGEDCTFEFTVSCRDASGMVLDFVFAALKPGLRETDRDWRAVQLDLGRGSSAAAVLDLRFESSRKDPYGCGIFAEPVFLDTWGKNY